MTISERVADMPALMRYLFPAAKTEKQGRKLRSGDISGAPGGSCSIDARSGRWKDFATGEAGDAIDLLVARGLAHDASDAYHWLETGGWLSLDAPRPAPAAPPPPPARRELPPAPMDKHRAPTRKQLLDYAAYDGITLSEQAIPCFNLPPRGRAAGDGSDPLSDAGRQGPAPVALERTPMVAGRNRRGRCAALSTPRAAGSAGCAGRDSGGRSRHGSGGHRPDLRRPGSYLRPGRFLAGCRNRLVAAAGTGCADRPRRRRRRPPPPPRRRGRRAPGRS